MVVTAVKKFYRYFFDNLGLFILKPNHGMFLYLD